MWMGGNLPLGYDRPTDLTTRALVLNEAEAATVRLIFAKYLELQSVHALRRWLDYQGIISKQWTSTRGKLMGGQPFGRGALFHLLKNRIYLGQIVHRGALHPGAHPVVVDEAVFDAVQTSLQDRNLRHHQRPTRVASALLKGLVFDSAGEPMSPTFSQGRGGRLHRYYVSAAL
jgi:site-specific DNA recombinase